eukprot:TRINITY_DN518_c0_g1_i2.p1 TRINITY_DN518_c0_g1~~TRINITY_DN518_c0_g1_i2.p1  ORF type:complete len:218 (+),score=20.22 TRINITY_DN518_c0_g1_i2:183-836(+)
MICVLLAIPLVTTAVNVRGVDEKLGWKVGEILRQTVTAAAADARHADGNQFQTALRSQLDEDSRVLVNPRVSELVSRANRILPETPERDAVCNRSWSVACPDGWKLVGNSCIAPRSYTGGCHRLVDTEGYTQLQKERFAHDCHVRVAVDWQLSEYFPVPGLATTNARAAMTTIMIAHVIGFRWAVACASSGRSRHPKCVRQRMLSEIWMSLKSKSLQ